MINWLKTLRKKEDKSTKDIERIPTSEQCEEPGC